jgi:hypothetical protein
LCVVVKRKHRGRFFCVESECRVYWKHLYLKNEVVVFGMARFLVSQLFCEIEFSFFPLVLVCKFHSDNQQPPTLYIVV